MNRRIFYSIFAVLMTVAIIGCSDDNTSSPPEEFVAADADFANWMSWTKIAENSGPDPALGEAHSGNDSTVTRYIYNKGNPVKGSNGQYPNGTIVVKETKDKDGNVMMITAMAKRGGTFNSANNGWEWFVLDGNTIMDRGADLMGGMCNGCHSAVKTTKDYVFSKD